MTLAAETSLSLAERAVGAAMLGGMERCVRQGYGTLRPGSHIYRTTWKLEMRHSLIVLAQCKPHVTLEGGIIWSRDGVRCLTILDGAFPGSWRAGTKPF
jgi:hypothetical protein